MSANTSFANFERALQKLDDFLSEPVESERDRAGVIQAFEFTFERFWKACQQFAQDQGLEARSPKQALQAALKLAIVDPEDEEVCLQMLDDRNLTSHTYNESLAAQVAARTKGAYAGLFRKALRNLQR